MMKESIVIRNFGPIEKIEITDILPFTIFVGESGSGKSTVMKAIILFRWIYKWVNIRSYLRHSNISRSPFRFDFKSLLNSNGLIEYLKDDTEIIYTKGDNSISYAGSLKANIIIPEVDLSLEKMCFIADKRNIIPDILSNKVSLQSDFYLKETLDDILLAFNEIKQLDVKYLGVKFTLKKENGINKYNIESTKSDKPYKISLYNASSGTQTLVPLSVIIEYFSKHYDFNARFNAIVLDYLARNDSLKDFSAKQNIGDIKHRNVHIHIEEPELSLYPDNQRSLINFIVNRCFVETHPKYEMTVMMTTHSPYIINHLNLLIKANDRGKLIEGARLDFDRIAVYQIADGKLYDLKIENERLINTNILSEAINDIYDQYEQL